MIPSAHPSETTASPALAARIGTFVGQNPKLSAAFLLFSWILCHPWFGFWHDGLLYLGQALHLVSPANYAADAYFMHGSQDDYTVFTRLYAALIRIMGASASGQILMLTANLAWFSLIYAVFSRMLGETRLAIVACASTMILPAFYGGQNIFWFNEPFLTSRSYSELAGLAGIYCMAGRRPFVALAWMVAASILHPLMGLGGLMVWYVHQLLRPAFKYARIVAVAAAAILAVAIVAMTLKGVGPFAGLGTHYDQRWWYVVLAFNADVLLGAWNSDDWVLKAGPFILYILYFRLAGRTQNRSVLSALVITAWASLVVSFVGGDWLKNVFVLSIQSWRAFWLYQAIVPGFVIGWLVGQSRHLPLATKWSATLAVLAMLMQHSAVSLILLASGLMLAFVRTIPIRDHLVRILNMLLACTVLLAIITHTLQEALFVSVQFSNTRLQLLDAHIVAATIFLVLITLCALVSHRSFSFSLLIIFAVLTLASWDRRSPQQELFESAAANNPFSPLIAPGDVVYWNDFKPLPWLILNRATYANTMQGSAVLFNRDFTADFVTRQTSLFHHYESKECPREFWARAACADTEQNINPSLCRTDSRMNWIVSSYKASYPAAAHWDIKTADYPNGLNLYSCKTWLALPYAPPAQAPAPAKASQ